MPLTYDPKGFWWGEDVALGIEDRRVNAAYIRNTCITDTWAFMCPGYTNGWSEGKTAPAWTLAAIAAFCGNCRVESWLNPGVYEGRKPTGRGYGLVQWTPGTLLRDWANSLGYPTYDIDVQLGRLRYEYDNKLEWAPRGDYTDVRNFQQFTQGTDIDHLTGAFWRNYLRSAASSKPVDSEEYQKSLATRCAAARGYLSFLRRTPAKPPWRPTPGGDASMYYVRRRR